LTFSDSRVVLFIFRDVAKYIYRTVMWSGTIYIGCIEKYFDKLQDSNLI